MDTARLHALWSRGTCNTTQIDMKTKFIVIIIVVGLIQTIGVAQTNDTVLTASHNPFASSTELTIHNLSDDTVSFNIFNSVGELVANFYDSIVLSGTITKVFTADTLQDGLYFSVLTKNRKNHVLKLLKDTNATGLTDQHIKKTKVQVYPNPTNNFITIKSSMQLTGLEIYDIHGKQLLQINNGQKNIIDLINFESGLYLLYIEIENWTYIKKIIKE